MHTNLCFCNRIINGKMNEKMNENFFWLLDFLFLSAINASVFIIYSISQSLFSSWNLRFPDCQNKDDRLKPIRSECIQCLFVCFFFTFFAAFSVNFLGISLRNLRIVSNYYQAADVWVFLSLMFCHLWSVWQYGLWSFQTGETKLERLLPKN